jgi:hypothetical protein
MKDSGELRPNDYVYRKKHLTEIWCELCNVPWDGETPELYFTQLESDFVNTLVNKGKKQILVGAIPRSGKTYIMAGTILRHAKEHAERELNNGTPPTYNNYVIITPAPNETLPQYKEAFDNHIDFKRYNIEAGIIKNERDLDFNENQGKHFVYLISKFKF